MAQTSRTFRIFVSSTFSDLKEERNALQKNVFPRLRELCMQHGCRFQAIDLRWGVREEASLDQQTTRICTEEIQRCQRVTPRPNFIMLLGDRYGWRPLPYEISAEEFVEIERLISDVDKELLSYWYKRDENAVPPVYCLQPRTGEFADYAKWEVVERRLRDILLQATAEMELPAEERVKYTASATEQEIVQGLKAPKSDEHVFCFFRTVKDLPQDAFAKDFIDLDEIGNLDEDATIQLHDLKESLRDRLPGNIYEYEAAWTARGLTTDHIDKLSEDVYNSLARIINKEIAQFEEIDPRDKEIADHHAFGKDRTKFFIGRAAILKTISDYIERTDSHPLGIFGEGGSGKSALTAYALEQARKEHREAEIVLRFSGATPSSSDGRALLESLCRQISRSYGGDESTIPTAYEELVDEFPKRLALATSEKPLILFLDSLDQLSDAYNARNLTWLPGDLPENVSLIVTTRPGECLVALGNKLPPENLVELEPMPLDEGSILLDRWLENAGRTLQDFQRKEVLNKFASCGLPLYLKLAFEEARRWMSYSPPTKLSLDIPGVIHDLFARLSMDANHGKIMVSRSLGYLAASRDLNGLSEDELLDILSSDKEVFEDFKKRAKHTPPEERLSVVVWSRLYFDLEPYLTERSAEGATLLSFYHRELGYVAKNEYLAKDEEKKRHQLLAAYFRSKADPDGDGTWDGIPRALSELPYHETKAEMWDELQKTLTSFNFLENKASRVGVYEYTDAKGNWIKVYNGVFALQEDFEAALQNFPTS